MILTLGKNDLKMFLRNQLSTFFPDQYSFSGSDVDSAFDQALERAEYCFKHITLPGYLKDGIAFFSHLHSDQYSMFLYFLSNSLWKVSQNKPICDKIILLNKALNGMFYSYKAQLPDIFLLQHPLGTVIGNADYSNFLVVFQNVTINTNTDEAGNSAPHIGKGVLFAAGAKVIGNKSIGDRCAIGVNTMIFDREIPPDSIVYTDSDGKLNIVKRKKECAAQKCFNVQVG